MKVEEFEGLLLLLPPSAVFSQLLNIAALDNKERE